MEYITNIVTAVSALILSGTAIYGVKQWKRQLKGQTDYDVARRCLRSALKLRDAVNYVRNPFIPISEMEAALKEDGINSEEYTENEKTNRAVYSIRWKKVQEAWSEFDAEFLEAEVLWGSQVANISNSLIIVVRRLYGSLQVFLSGHKRFGRKEDDIIYNTGSIDNPDDYSKEINKAIEDVRLFLKGYLD